MRLTRYEARTSALMTALALLFLGVYAVTVIVTEPAWLVRAAQALSWVIWALFALDLGLRVWLAEHRLRWLAAHPIDVLSVALPALRPLRVLRVFTAGQSLLARRGGLVRTGQAIVFTAALLVLVGALAELEAEKSAPDATITSIGDALWWAMTTVTTVGYGDLYPVTTQGRLVATALMIVGISVLGVVTASVAAWFVEQTQLGREASTTDARAQLTSLHAAGVLTDEELTSAEARLSVSTPAPTPPERD